MVVTYTPEVITTTLDKPRILCLHGGGTNARIFKAQCRFLERRLSADFRLVYAEAPFASEAGPDVVSVYKSFGPFKRWLRSAPHQPHLPHGVCVRELDRALQTTMEDDDNLGATGEWVGLLGFSQGAKMAASLLLRQQLRDEVYGIPSAGPRWRFAVVLAGRGPLVNLDAELMNIPGLAAASDIGNPHGPPYLTRGETRHILRLPTIHVHGLQDPGLDMHRDLLAYYHAPSTSRLLEWDGNHRVALKTKDVTPLVDQIMDVSKQTGVCEVTRPQFLEVKEARTFWEEVAELSD